ncbi:T6SS immunity protein Tli4 family protein [Orbus wheelerorum]|uniref:T6SS immunity protein Tli4 family protein n=1 Tax=Orbus wheelerorum TaxID=3074111 RepID=UPI00370D9D09
MIELVKLNKRRYGIVASLLALTVLTSCQIFNKDIKMTTLPLKEQQQVTALLSNSLTRCIGTYLIDFPVAFKVNRESLFYYKDTGDVIITTKQQYLPPFKQLIALREEALKKTKTVDPIDSPYLKAIYPVHTNHPDKIQGIIFERMESQGTDDSARVLEGYRWQDEVTLKIEMKAQNGSDEKHDENRIKYPELYTNDVPQRLLELRKLFDRIKPRDDLTIPTTPGFCLLRGFMQGEEQEWKNTGVTYQHDSDNDFYFNISYNNYKGYYKLLDQSESYVTEDRGHTIYKGTRESHGLKLEEWLVKGQFFSDESGYDSDDWGYKFILGINMLDPSHKTPQLQIKMTYRIPEDETQGYTQAQLIVIWREITNSIKIRESSFEPE